MLSGSRIDAFRRGQAHNTKEAGVVFFSIVLSRRLRKQSKHVRVLTASADAAALLTEYASSQSSQASQPR